VLSHLLPFELVTVVRDLQTIRRPHSSAVASIRDTSQCGELYSRRLPIGNKDSQRIQPNSVLVEVHSALVCRRGAGKIDVLIRGAAAAAH
jgi:hypothetical protein